VFQSGYLSKRGIVMGIILSPLAVLFSLPVIRDGIRFLAQTRQLRSHGRAAYLQEIVPQTIPQFIGFSWVGAFYFLYAPFPWMIETIPDLITGTEAIISIGFTIAAIWGVRLMGQKNSFVTVGLIVGLAVAVTLYGVGTVNYGLGTRQRQMFLWVIFIFGGIGLSNHVKIQWPFSRDWHESDDANR
jgi:uncharacterized membrane protein (DUF441 family)